MENTLTPEQIDLLETIDKIDIKNIYAIRFHPKNKEAFNVKTERMRKISKYVVEKLGKTDFAPLELATVYSHVKTHLPSELPFREREQLEEVLFDFVKVGGAVTFTTNGNVNARRILIGIISFGIMVGFYFTIVGGVLPTLSGAHTKDIMFYGFFCFVFVFLLVSILHVNNNYEKDIKDVIAKSFMR